MIAPETATCRRKSAAGKGGNVDTELQELLALVRGLASEMAFADCWSDDAYERETRKYIAECADKIIAAIDAYGAAALPVPVTADDDGPADYCAAGEGA